MQTALPFPINPRTRDPQHRAPPALRNKQIRPRHYVQNHAKQLAFGREHRYKQPELHALANAVIKQAGRTHLATSNHTQENIMLTCKDGNDYERSPIRREEASARGQTPGLECRSQRSTAVPSQPRRGATQNYLMRLMPLLDGHDPFVVATRLTRRTGCRPGCNSGGRD